MGILLGSRCQEPWPPKPRIRVNPRLHELQTAKEILEEVFHTRPGEAEEMIKRRLEEELERGPKLT